MKPVWFWIVGTVSTLVVACVFGFNFLQLRDSFGSVNHTQVVLLTSAQLETNQFRAEAASRGYVLTGNDRYLYGYLKAQSATGITLDQLKTLVSDNPAQNRAIASIEQEIDQRLAFSSRAIEATHTSLAAAVKIVDSDEAHALRQAIADQLQAFRGVEMELLQLRQQSADRAEFNSLILGILAVCGVLVFIAAGTYLMMRDRERVQVERMQGKITQISRLNTIGQNATMLAHELTQPITACSTFLHASLRMMSGNFSPEEVREAVAAAAKQAERVGEVVGHLRTFIAGGKGDATIESIASVIDETIELLALPRDGAQITRNFNVKTPPVRIDRVQIQQVLVNLVRNAIQAMDGVKRKEIGFCATPEGHTMVRVSVSDSGPGLSAKAAAKLFEPVYSSKKGGMGVGLSICHTLVEANGGRIWVEPNVSGGAVFHFTIPVAGRTAIDSVTPPSAA